MHSSDHPGNDRSQQDGFFESPEKMRVRFMEAYLVTVKLELEADPQDRRPLSKRLTRHHPENSPLPQIEVHTSYCHKSLWRQNSSSISVSVNITSFKSANLMLFSTPMNSV